jgi:type II secretion system protein G
MKKNKIQRAFTLIELLVVISIIGILIALGVASYTTAQRKARDSKRKADLETVRQALVLYRQDNGDYGNISNGYNSMVDALYPDYLTSQSSSLQDPKYGTNPFWYRAACTLGSNPNCSRVTLTAYLENNDPDNPEQYDIITP